MQTTGTIFGEEFETLSEEELTLQTAEALPVRNELFVFTHCHPVPVICEPHHVCPQVHQCFNQPHHDFDNDHHGDGDHDHDDRIQHNRDDDDCRRINRIKCADRDDD